MTRARRHQRFLSAGAFVLLALVAELLGRSLTNRFDFGRHVSARYATADYYPILLMVVKLGIALMAARLVWRFVRARAAARAGRRMLVAMGAPPVRAPRPRLVLSPRLWASWFALTATIYLVQTDVERLSAGRWPLLAPWLHSSALPVFAVLSVFMALIWRAVQSWLADYETYAREAVARAERLSELRPILRPALHEPTLAPRRIFGIAFESRPPPLTA